MAKGKKNKHRQSEKPKTSALQTTQAKTEEVVAHKQAVAEPVHDDVHATVISDDASYEQSALPLAETAEITEQPVENSSTEQVYTASVVRFEAAVCQRDYEQACEELLQILRALDHAYGGTHTIACHYPRQISLYEEWLEHFATRMAAAVSTLFMDKDFVLSADKAEELFLHQRWLSLIFAASPYLNADHVLLSYSLNADIDDMQLPPDEQSLLKFCVLYLTESNISLDLNALYAIAPKMVVALCLALQSSRFLGTESAFQKRHAILQWLPESLLVLEDWNGLPVGVFHDVYMHCSYDIAPNKHAIKSALNTMIRRQLTVSGWQDYAANTINLMDGKPVLLVILEHFNEGHSIYRTHSTSLRAAREHFYVIGVGYANVDSVGREVFDLFLELDEALSIAQRVQVLRNISEHYGAAVLYMPSVGMDLATIFVSNTRLAPIQVVALGHPATTHSPFIDYVVVEDDYVGSEACFTEQLIRLPKDALPYIPSGRLPEQLQWQINEQPAVVQIGIAATTMKLNPYFLAACQQILERVRVPVHFHFAVGQSVGLMHLYVKRFIKSYLGEHATVYEHAPYEHYMQTLQQCDMMLNPFPFGNTNGIIDMVTLGLVGVCKTGDEVHEHIDEGLFKRLGLPEWLITQTAEEYVDCAVRLAENHAERVMLRRYLLETNSLQILFSGNPAPLGQILREKIDALLSDVQA